MSNTVSVSESSNSVVVVESDNTVTVTQADNSVIVTAPAALRPGGATNDILVKQSATDYDIAWQDTAILDKIGFDTLADETITTPGEMAWDADFETVDVLLRNGSSTPTKMHIGQDEFFWVKASATITRGQVVYYTGTEGASGHILAAPFLADGTYPSKTVIGVATQDAAVGEFIHVLWRGKLRSFDTSTLTPGILYASTTVAGGFQSTQPVAPNNIVTVAVAVDSKNNGTILVRPTFAGSLAESEDVSLSSPAAGEVLTYNGTTWGNEATANPLTVASTSRTSPVEAQGLPNTWFVAQGGNRNFSNTTLWVWPFVVTDPIEISSWIVRVTVNSSATTESMAAGIYEWSASLDIGDLVSEFPSLSIPTGLGVYETALASPLTLQTGRYAIAWHVSTTSVSFRTPQTVSPFQRLSQANTSPARLTAGAHASGSPLPNPAPGPIAINTDGANWGPPVFLTWDYV